MTLTHDHIVDANKKVTPDHLEAIKARLRKATPGPWRDFTHEYPEAVANSTKPNYHGTGRYRYKRFLCLIAHSDVRGQAVNPDTDCPIRVDLWDFTKVVCIPWNDKSNVKTQAEGVVTPHDRALIANAPTDLTTLIDEVERLRADRDHWRANHADMVAHNAMLRDRPDLPADRLPQTARYEAEIKRLRAELAESKYEHASDVFGESSHREADDLPGWYCPYTSASKWAAGELVRMKKMEEHAERKGFYRPILEGVEHD